MLAGWGREKWVGGGQGGRWVDGREGFLWLNYKNQKCSNPDLVEKTEIPVTASPWMSPSDQNS